MQGETPELTRTTPATPGGSPFAGGGSSPDPSLPAALLEQLAAGARVRGLVVAVEAGWPGEWSVRLEVPGGAVRARSSVQVAVGTVHEFRAADPAQPTQWTLVPRRSSSAEPSSARRPGNPGAELGAALDSLSGERGRGRAIQQAAVTVARSSGSTEPATPVVTPGPRVAAAQVASAFQLLRDGGLVPALLETAASTRPAGERGTVSGDEARAQTSAVDALRSLGTALVEASRARELAAPLVPIPLPFRADESLHGLRCYLGVEGDGVGAPAARGGEPGFLVVLLLELSELGSLRVDVQTGRGGVRVRFAVEEDESRAAVRDGLAELREDLAAGLPGRSAGGALELSVCEPDESTALLREVRAVERQLATPGGFDVHV